MIRGAATKKKHPNPNGGWYSEFGHAEGLLETVLIARAMSTVIMAVCYDRTEGDIAKPYIVAACDTKLSSGFTSIPDSGFLKVQKVQLLSKWLLGFAGEPHHFTAIRARFGLSLRLLEDAVIEQASHTARDGDQVPSPAGYQVVEALKSVYTDYRNAIIRERFLDPLGLENAAQLAAMASHGIDVGDLIAEISHFDLGITLIMGGFADHGGIKMVTIDDDGLKDRYFSSPAYAIGNGKIHAMMHLNRLYQREASLKEAVYRVLEAKFLSEDADAVGSGTGMLILRQDCNVQYVTKESIAAFRPLWEVNSKMMQSELLDALSFSQPSIL